MRIVADPDRREYAIMGMVGESRSGWRSGEDEKLPWLWSVRARMGEGAEKKKGSHGYGR